MKDEYGKTQPSSFSLHPYNGMFPCFFGGFLSRLLRSMEKAVISLRRVKRGSMISST